MTRPRRPAILAVDDDRGVLSAIRRDLTGAYGSDYRVLATGSGTEALGLLEQLSERRQQPALLIVDQRMPEMTGIEFLSRAVVRFPQARRVLLTAYADTEVAITGINEVGLHHYLTKPWEPPEDRLYPVLDRLLADWHSAAC